MRMASHTTAHRLSAATARVRLPSVTAPLAGEAQLLAMVWRISAAEARACWEVATAATLEGCARELESLDAAPGSKAAGEEPQPVAVVRDHPEATGP